MLAFYILFFLVGLCVGSFLNVVILRIPQKRKITGRSRCPNCKKNLRWYDLVPVFSYIFLRGKCSYCKKPISWQYPLVELSTGFLFVLVFWRTITTIIGQLSVGLFINLIFLFFFTSILIIIFTSDIKYYIVPDEVIYPAIVVALFYQLFKVFEANNWRFVLNFASFRPFIYSLFAGLGAALFFFLLVVITKGKGMGLGDVKIAFFMGILLSVPNIFVALLLAFFGGSMVGLILIVAKKKTLKSEVPFGCFLAPSTFIAFFWGAQLISLYFRLIM